MRIPANLRHVTGGLIIVTVVAWVLYDVLPFASQADGDTISEVLADWGSPPIWLAIGFLLGHFWPIEVVLRRIWAKPESA